VLLGMNVRGRKHDQWKRKAGLHEDFKHKKLDRGERRAEGKI
jgi:hypothetical protein